MEWETVPAPEGFHLQGSAPILLQALHLSAKHPPTLGTRVRGAGSLIAATSTSAAPGLTSEALGLGRGLRGLALKGPCLVGGASALRILRLLLVCTGD